jgi:pSer/pThr/pTyr-binding forkhead associated (FHA) protein
MVEPSAAPSPLELKERIQAEQLGMSFLIYNDAEGRQQIYTLEDTAYRKITVGRALAVDVSLAWDLKISGIHAELERVGDDWVVIDDGLSRNGTFVNGERLNGRRRLVDGDTLRFGSTTAVYRAPPSAEYSSTLEASRMAAVGPLSDAQRRVLIALCRPFKGSPPVATPATNQQIADELFLSVEAVKSHMRALFQKFDVEQLPQNQKRARVVELAFDSGHILQRDL